MPKPSVFTQVLTLRLTLFSFQFSGLYSQKVFHIRRRQQGNKGILRLFARKAGRIPFCFAQYSLRFSLCAPNRGSPKTNQGAFSVVLNRPLLCSQRDRPRYDPGQSSNPFLRSASTRGKALNYAVAKKVMYVTAWIL